MGLFRCLEPIYQAEADEQRDGPEYAETAIDKAPEKRNAADWPGDKGEEDNGDAGDDAELKYPLVAKRVLQGTEESDREYEMGEGEPVGAISDEGIAEAGIAEGVAHFPNPKDYWAGQDGMRVKEGCEPDGFMFEREGSESAEDESQDKERKPKAYSAENLSICLKRGWHVLAIVAQA